jgi:acyl-coenzyme A thioesterase PaaI-like protein
MDSRFFKLLLNFYPPYLGAGIRIRKVAPDFREITVQMRLRWYNRNYFNTHFGGSLYAMVDPFYCLMLVQILGKAYIVWDQAAQIEFLKPGRGTVTAEFRIGAEQVDEIVAQTADGRKFLSVYPVDVRDASGETIARINKTLYIRRKKR